MIYGNSACCTAGSAAAALRATYTGDDTNARAQQVLREGAVHCRQWRLGPVQRGQQDQPEASLHPEVVRQAAAEVVSEDEAAARLAARDRLAVPGMHAGGAAGHPRRKE